jgi:ectoine hydroxylase-related dioxygenase (phytanoyl-CoA dioxygenase family)
MNYKDKLENDGYFILQNVFTKYEINLYRDEILDYVQNTKTIKNGGGITVPDFIKKKELKNTSLIKNNEKILSVLDILFNKNYRFCNHNDIGINRVVGWHKDKLNGEVSKYETHNIWKEYNGEKHEIVKVLIYLEDHSNDNDGLKLVPNSHLVPHIKTEGWIQLKPKIGDVVIFDQRITHRGMAKQVPNPRILISLGFGKNNIFTDNFERGTVTRQNSQNK